MKKRVIQEIEGRKVSALGFLPLKLKLPFSSKTGGTESSNPVPSTPQSLSSRTFGESIEIRACARFAIKIWTRRTAAAALIGEVVQNLSALDLSGSTDVRPSASIGGRKDSDAKMFAFR